MKGRTILTRRNQKGGQAKEFLAKYGGAYLATSITLSLISFALCYALINAGVDVQALLQKVGISTNETWEPSLLHMLHTMLHLQLGFLQLWLLLPFLPVGLERRLKEK